MSRYRTRRHKKGATRKPKKLSPERLDRVKSNAQSTLNLMSADCRDRIASQLDSKGLILNDLNSMLGKDPTWATKALNRPNGPLLCDLVLIAEALGCSIDFYFG